MRLGLGTVQFGLPYGVSNTAGQPLVAEVEGILAMADTGGIAVLDTAVAYGEAESVLGQSLTPGHRFDIVTKTPVFGVARIGAEHVQRLHHTFDASLRALRQDRIHGLLFHRAADLLAPGGHLLIDAMMELAGQERVEKLGVSVYSADEIDRILDVFTPDLVQLPVSIFDQRLLASGHLAKLKSKGIEIHARSIFLQGLLLMEDAPAYFQPIRDRLDRYAEFLAQSGLTRLEAALSFVSAIPEVDVALVGVTRAAELAEILAAREAVSGRADDFSAFAVADEKMVNPALWKV